LICGHAEGCNSRAEGHQVRTLQERESGRACHGMIPRPWAAATWLRHDKAPAPRHLLGLGELLAGGRVRRGGGASRGGVGGGGLRFVGPGTHVGAAAHISVLGAVHGRDGDGVAALELGRQLLPGGSQALAVPAPRLQGRSRHMGRRDAGPGRGPRGLRRHRAGRLHPASCTHAGTATQQAARGMITDGSGLTAKNLMKCTLPFVICSARRQGCCGPSSQARAAPERRAGTGCRATVGRGPAGCAPAPHSPTRASAHAPLRSR